jgi:hypothetical protein
MNIADWMLATAAIGGVIGIGLGLVDRLGCGNHHLPRYFF